MKLSRREFVTSTTALAGLSVLSTLPGVALAQGSPDSLIAHPPVGFVPLSLPGRVAKVTAKGDFASIMQRNQMWPKPEVAKRMLERALMELTGAPNMVEAMKKFIHKDDIVAIKPNGIAGSGMSTSFELIAPLVEACIAAGVASESHHRVRAIHELHAFDTRRRAQVRSSEGRCDCRAQQQRLSHAGRQSLRRHYHQVLPADGRRNGRHRHGAD